MKKLVSIILTTLFIGAFFNTLYAQKVIKGMITDPQQNPVSGAIIQTIPGNISASSNDQGVFEIAIPKGTKGISISKTRFVRKEIDIAVLQQQLALAHIGSTTIRIQLEFAKNIELSDLSENPLKESVLVASATKNQTIGFSRSKRYYIPAPTYSIPSESYAHQKENGFRSVSSNPLSTFSIDVDKAAYSNIRRIIAGGQLPPADAVRIEEMINYFDYHYDQPKDNQPINLITYMGQAPWNSKHQLIQIGLQGKQISAENLPPSNLVFLIDVSGSMSAVSKLPLLITGFKMLTDRLRAEDRVAIVTYAGSSQTVLNSTSGSSKEQIKAALDGLRAGGSTNGAGGIEQAYAMAEKHFMKKGNNRVILASDGDFNVGISSLTDLEKLIVEKRKSGIYLSVLGFGMGNYKDDKMEKLADEGNGNYAYIDNSMEAQRVLLKEFGGTLFTIANDVKVQVEFNPAEVIAYRLIGYENRALAAEDFNQDTVDAGEMGSGQSVTALYEIIPQGIHDDPWRPEVDSLKYQHTERGFHSKNTPNGELATIKLRYKQPGQNKSQLISQLIKHNDRGRTSILAGENFQFATAVAGLGMLLSQSAYTQDFHFEQVVALAKQAKGQDTEGDRAGFIQLAQAAEALQGNQAKNAPPISYDTPPIGYKPGPRPLINQLR